MPSQNDYDRVKRIIIDPIVSLYATKLPESFVEAIVDELAKYPNDVLTAAFIEIRRNCKMTPRIAHLVEACRNASPERSTNSGSAEGIYAALRERDNDAVNMAKRFIEAFYLSDLAQRAREGRWETLLLEYAYEAALLQARFMSRAANPGYNQNVLTGGRKLETEETDRRIRHFINACRSQATTGTIDVAPPDYLIDEWQADGQSRIKAA